MTTRQPTPTAGLPVPAAVSTGLEAIRSFEGRDEELCITAGGFFEEPFMTGQMVTAEEVTRFIKKTEALVRGCREYKAFIAHLRIDLGMDRCSFLANADVSDGVALEFHHCPLNLYEIIDLILTHRLARGQAVTSMTVADEVLQAHFAGMVGVVPLLRSIHKLVHGGTLKIHPAMVHGNWLELLRSYPDGASEEIVAKLIAFCETSEEEVAAAAARVDGATASPRLRGDSVPTPGQIGLLLTLPAA